MECIAPNQSPEWTITILSHVNCFIHGEVVGFQVLLDTADLNVSKFGKMANFY